MPRPPVVPAEEKSRLVLSILAGEMTIAEAARRAKVSEQSVSNWERQFLEAGRQGVAEGGKPGPNSRDVSWPRSSKRSKPRSVKRPSSCACGTRGRRPPPIEDLEMIHSEAGMSITRFSELVGMPRRTYTRHRGRFLADDPPLGCSWPAPVFDAIEPAVARLATEFPAWGHRGRD